MTGTTSSYTRQVLAGEQPQVEAAAITAALDEDDDDGVIHGSKSLSDIELAWTPRTFSLSKVSSFYFYFFLNRARISQDTSSASCPHPAAPTPGPPPPLSG